MMPVTLSYIMDSPVGERTIRTLRIADVQVPDGVGGVRFPSASELAGLELTLTDEATGEVINEVDAVLLLPDHGTYNSVTGVLLLNLVADDNPIMSTTLGAGKKERHVVLVHLPEVLWVEITISVQNQSRIPVPAP